MNSNYQKKIQRGNCAMQCNIQKSLDICPNNSVETVQNYC